MYLLLATYYVGRIDLKNIFRIGTYTKLSLKKYLGTIYILFFIQKIPSKIYKDGNKQH